MLLTVILIFLYFNDKMSLEFVKIFTIFSMLLMLVIFIGYIYVLIQRLSGTARRGMGDRYPSLLSTDNDLDFELSGLPSRNNRVRSRLSETSYGRAQKRSGFSDFEKKSDYMSGFRSDFRRSRKSRVSGGRRSRTGYDDWEYDYGRYLERSDARSYGSNRERSRDGGRHHGYMNFDRDF